MSLGVAISCSRSNSRAVDADALKPYLPPGGAARVLVTSNAHTWRGVAAPVEIRQWPKEIGADFLIARNGRTAERDAALALSEALGGLPLAHEQAAAYCEWLDRSLAEYAKHLTAAPAKFLDNARHAPPEHHDRLRVTKTFALAIDEAAKLHPAAEPLIVYAALLAPEPIPLFLFSQGREKFGEPLATVLEGDGVDEAVAALRKFALGCAYGARARQWSKPPMDPRIWTPRGSSTTSPTCCGRRATSRGRGHSMSARWRSGRRRLAPSIRPPRRASATSPSCCRPSDLARARPLHERALAI